ncbi:unnamed protein product [Rotaria sordida]|uniref:Uncharacterized protein n=1 Tax=Rotaria sordida TaxID=392033 RepID=A0A815IJ51_9BILA|nr:unnamed protein product [Rotaria sordida]CAF1334659.1 unnamed protein product [Rotaria sordida]CAF1366649.1 unnamed protein product [Rotaria sordida]CAF1539310.1 unnamed protein product [Rotaria sordida]CAF3938079.1 unnamed protein product [Rotaria sordida]
MESCTAIKSSILKAKSGRKTYNIRHFSLSNRFDIQRLCIEERVEILIPLSRACFRNRFTFLLLLLLLLCIIISMFIFSRLIISFLISSALITSFVIYHITRLKYKI